MIERKDCIRALTAHPTTTLAALADELSSGCEVRWTRLPQAGLGLLRLSDGAFHEPYYLGEFPLSVCGVELIDGEGRRAAGAAQVMADDAALARALAILDGVLAARFAGWERIAVLIEAGVSLRAEEDRRRRIMLASTRVDFALLSSDENAGDADED
ncbi:MAG: phosphonate C-P lyase system protein PhnG [Nevskiaceae bacterium]|nr:phosphonate C-P lyase system protein PhnG [Nevskiaceae bacterium]